MTVQVDVQIQGEITTVSKMIALMLVLWFLKMRLHNRTLGGGFKEQWLFFMNFTLPFLVLEK